jgi:hypothetical protein
MRRDLRGKTLDLLCTHCSIDVVVMHLVVFVVLVGWLGVVGRVCVAFKRQYELVRSCK